MVRGTTPTFRATFTDETLDLTNTNNVYVTFKQGENLITKSGEALEVAEKQVDVFLSQEETLRFKEGYAEMQVNWTYEQGKRACSNVATVRVGKNLVWSVLE